MSRRDGIRLAFSSFFELRAIISSYFILISCWPAAKSHTCRYKYWHIWIPRFLVRFVLAPTRQLCYKHFSYKPHFISILLYERLLWTTLALCVKHREEQCTMSCTKLYICAILLFTVYELLAVDTRYYFYYALHTPPT